jgi:dTDP-4-dehydrorhamnose reductase
LNIVSDQIGTPTFAGDLGQAILDIIKSDKFNVFKKKSEIYHYSNEGKCSWYDFAKEIVSISGAKCNISPINTEGYSAAAKRPKFTVMSKEKISKEFDLKIISWKESLKYCMNNLSTAPTLNKY